MHIKQHTILKSVTISGVGLHTGVDVNMTFLPAPPNHGVKFQRVDIEGQPTVDADVDNVVDLFFSNDAKKPKSERGWPTRKDWVQHLTNLADQVVRNHRRVEDAQMLADAINDMTNRLKKHKSRMSAVFKRQINNTLKRLEDIKK